MRQTWNGDTALLTVPRFRAASWLMLGTWLLGQATSASAAHDSRPLALQLASGSTAVFADGTYVYEVELISSEAWSGIVQIEHSVQHRTLARKELAVTLAANTLERKTFELTMPPVNTLVVQKTHLQCRCLQPQDDETASTLEKDIFVFPREAFAGRQEWARRLKLHVFDPEGNTVRRLEQADVPFERVRTLQNLASRSEGMVLVGSGLRFRQSGSFAETLAGLAQRGVPVLCLAPKAAEIPLTFGVGIPATEELALTGMTFRSADIIRELDPRLDPAALLSTSEGVSSESCRVHLICERGRVLARMQQDSADIPVTTTDRGWPWLRVDYRGGGLVTYCGFDIVGRWDNGPTARYLLIAILQSHSNSEQRTPKPDQRP